MHRVILLVGLIASLTACSQTPTRPTKPIIEASACQPGFVCFEHKDAAALAKYIIELEAIYETPF